MSTIQVLDSARVHQKLQLGPQIDIIIAMDSFEDIFGLQESKLYEVFVRFLDDSAGRPDVGQNGQVSHNQRFSHGQAVADGPNCKLPKMKLNRGRLAYCTLGE